MEYLITPDNNFLNKSQSSEAGLNRSGVMTFDHLKISTSQTSFLPLTNANGSDFTDQSSMCSRIRITNDSNGLYISRDLDRSSYMVDSSGADEDTIVQNDNDNGVPFPDYQEKVFFYLSQYHHPRDWCLKIISWPWFEQLSIAIIILNCVTLGMYKPCDGVQCITTRCKILKGFDHFVFIFFLLELMTKVCAMGLFGTMGYLAESWNRLDMLIVLAGSIEYIVPSEGEMSLTAIRTIRVLRPLRAINRIPSMRILVMLLLDTLPMLGNVLLLCFFVFFIFGIVGVQMWQGILRNRCYLHLNESAHHPGLNLSEFYITNQTSNHGAHSKDFICSPDGFNGLVKCSDIPPSLIWLPNGKANVCNESATLHSKNMPTNTSCVNWNQYYSKCEARSINPYYGAINFDNIGFAWVAIFQVISMESWVDIMYYVQDAHSFWDWIYFVSLIIIGSFFMINLCLVVIATQFAETKKRETERMIMERKKQQSTSTLGSNLEPQSCYHEIIKMISRLLRHLLKKLGKRYSILAERHASLAYIKERLRFLEGKKTTKKHRKKHKKDSKVTKSKSKNDKNPAPRLVKDFKYKDLDGTKFIDLSLVTAQSLTPRQSVTALQQIRCSQNNVIFDQQSDNANSTYLKCPSIRGLNGSSRSQSLSSESMLAASHMFIKLPQGHLQLISRSEIGKSQSSANPFILRRASWNSNHRMSPASLIKEEPNENSVDSKVMVQKAPDKAPGPINSIGVQKFAPVAVQFKNIQNKKKYEKSSQSMEESSSDSEIDDNEVERFGVGKMLRKKLKQAVAHDYFQRGILIAILINTLSMGIEYHEQPEQLTAILEYSNLIFNGLFLVEMLLKILADGLLGYISNGFNVFDGGIVILGFVELAQQGGASGLSVLRTFRLLRILKLIRFMPALRQQLIVMLKTMDNVATFFALLILFIFIFSILGMSLFGCKFCKVTDGIRKCDRKNFDSLLWAIVTVFQILTQEDWNAVLINGMFYTSSWAALYFVALMTFGNYVLFNLLVAILVEGFSTDRSEESKCAGKDGNDDEHELEENAKEDNSKFSMENKITIISNGEVNISEKDPIMARKGSLSQKQIMPIITHTDATPMPSPRASPFNDREMLHQQLEFLSRQSQVSPANCDGVSLRLPVVQSTEQKFNFRRGSDSSTAGTPPLKKTSQTFLHPNAAAIVNSDSQSLLPGEACVRTAPNSRPRSPSQQVFTVPITLNKFNSSSGQIIQHSGMLFRRSSVTCATCRPISNQGTQGSLTSSEKVEESCNSRCNLTSEDHIRVDVDGESSVVCYSRRSSVNSMSNMSRDSLRNSVHSFKNKVLLPRVLINKSYSSALNSNFQKESDINEEELSSLLNQDDEIVDDQNETDSNCEWLFELHSCFKTRYYHSLFLLSSDNNFRTYCQTLMEQKWFDNIILFFIALNCITLAMERPSIPQHSHERDFLTITNYVFTVIFTIEMSIKVIAKGLIVGGHTYLHSGWNVMDGFLVMISLGDILIILCLGHSNRIFGILRVFRLLRTLRPLRVISRAPGLKLVVQTLLSSLRPIGNIVLICCTFFIIFGILGVQLFKGKFYHCFGPDISHVHNKSDCGKDKRNFWRNHQYNFDNLGQALMALFVLSSKDGWVQIMYTGLDAVGVDQQPQENHNEWYLLYFISFLLLVGFFVLNMFVGVVVENFHKCRENQEKEEKARRAAKRARRLEKKKRKMMEPPYWDLYPQWRLQIHKLVNSKYFDLAIAGIIGLNVITMAMEFYMMPHELELALKSLNYIFTTVFIIEAIIKVFAIGPKRYIVDRWNQLDVLIVILSVSGIAMEEMKNKYIPINMTIIRVFRVLRIARVLKLLKMAKGIRALLDTVIQALPQVGNLGLLFFLLFFIFAALGVELFGRLECSDYNPCTGLSRHAHFENFGMAFLTLFRIATGDNWNGIMKDTLRSKCDNSEDCQKNCCVSPVIAPVYFVIFVLMAQFVLVNVVVAVLMKHLEESHKMMCDDDEIEKEVKREIEEENREKERAQMSLDIDENPVGAKCSDNIEISINIIPQKELNETVPKAIKSNTDKKKKVNSQDSTDSMKVTTKSLSPNELGSAGTLHILNFPTSKKLYEQLSQSQPLLIFNLHPDSLKTLNTVNNDATVKPMDGESRRKLLKHSSKKWNTMDDGFPDANLSKRYVYHLATDIPIGATSNSESKQNSTEDECDAEIQKITGVSNLDSRRRNFVMQKSYSMQQNLPIKCITINPGRYAVSKGVTLGRRPSQSKRNQHSEQNPQNKTSPNGKVDTLTNNQKVENSNLPINADKRRKMFASGGGKKQTIQDTSIELKVDDYKESQGPEKVPPSSGCAHATSPNAASSTVMAGSISRKMSNPPMNTLELPNPHLKCGYISPISKRSNIIPKITPEASEEYIDQDSAI